MPFRTWRQDHQRFWSGEACTSAKGPALNACSMESRKWIKSSRRAKPIWDTLRSAPSSTNNFIASILSQLQVPGCLRRMINKTDIKIEIKTRVGGRHWMYFQHFHQVAGYLQRPRAKVSPLDHWEGQPEIFSELTQSTSRSSLVSNRPWEGLPKTTSSLKTLILHSLWVHHSLSSWAQDTLVFGLHSMNSMA